MSEGVMREGLDPPTEALEAETMSMPLDPNVGGWMVLDAYRIYCKIQKLELPVNCEK